MIDDDDASHDRTRLAIARALTGYGDDELFDCLQDPEPILRTAAARRLHRRGTREVFERALTLIDHPRFEFREIGAFVLGQLGTPDCPFAIETFPLLSKLLTDPYGEVVAAAVGAFGSLATLGHQPPTSVLEQLLGLLTKERSLRDVDLARPVDDVVRARIAFALGAIDSPAALHALSTLVDDPAEEVRETAELGLDMHEGRAASDAGGRGRQAAGSGSSSVSRDQQAETA